MTVDHFRARLGQATKDGIVLAVKYGVVLVVLGWLIVGALGDYSTVRQGAAQGAEAFAFLQRQQAASTPRPVVP